MKIRPCNVQGRHVSSTVMTSTVMSTAAKNTKWLCAGEYLEQLRYDALRPDVVTMGAIMESWTFQHAWQRSICMLCLDNGWTCIFLSDKQGGFFLVWGTQTNQRTLVTERNFDFELFVSVRKCTYSCIFPADLYEIPMNTSRSFGYAHWKFVQICGKNAAKFQQESLPHWSSRTQEELEWKTLSSQRASFWSCYYRLLQGPGAAGENLAWRHLRKKKGEMNSNGLVQVPRDWHAFLVSDTPLFLYI